MTNCICKHFFFVVMISFAVFCVCHGGMKRSREPGNQYWLQSVPKMHTVVSSLGTSVICRQRDRRCISFKDKWSTCLNSSHWDKRRKFSFQLDRREKFKKDQMLRDARARGFDEPPSVSEVDQWSDSLYGRLWCFKARRMGQGGRDRSVAQGMCCKIFFQPVHFPWPESSWVW